MAEQETRTDEAQASAGANASGSAAASGGLNAQGSEKSTQSTKRTPPKLGKKNSQQPTPEATPSKEQPKATNGDSEVLAGDAPPPSQSASRAQSKRRQSRGRGRSRQPDSDTESIARSDISQPAQGRKNRNRKKGKPTQEAPPQSNGGQGGGPLDSLDEVGETVDGAGQLVGGVTDQAGEAVGGATDKVGKTVGGLTGMSRLPNCAYRELIKWHRWR